MEVLLMLVMQSESVTLSVDYLISSTQAGHAPAWVFFWVKERAIIPALRQRNQPELSPTPIWHPDHP